MYAVILAMVTLVMLMYFTLHHIVRKLVVPQHSHAEMKLQAITAIKAVGGADVLENEAKFILNNFQPASEWDPTSNGATNWPAIIKLDSLLSSHIIGQA